MANEPAPAAPTPAPTPTPETTAPATPPPADAGPTPPREGSPLGTAGAGDQSAPEGDKPEGEGDKPEGDKPEGEDGEGDKKGDALSADDIKKAIELPEGVSADDELLGKFSTFAAEAGLTLEQSQGLASMYFEAQEGLINQLAQANQKAWDTTIDDWKAEIESDPVIGGDKKEAAQNTLGKALDEYGTPEARRAFEVTGAGWNPAIIRFIHKMAQALTEGGVVVAPAPTKTGPKTLADVLYPQGGGGTQPAS